jgi:aryl carrier-like protein
MTGDLARWQPDGKIRFLGRSDHQVKVRGIRIELGEIETRLLAHPGVKEAVVLPGESKTGEKHLCAYIVPEKELVVSALRENLSKKLPVYMIPSFFLMLEKMPLTPTGKLDRKALPDAEIKRKKEYARPRNELEEILVKTWAGVLGLQGVGIDENFFEIGGDSIKAIQIGARLNKAGYKFEMKDIFAYPVISGLAPQLKKIERIPHQSPVRGNLPLTPIQKWFFGNQTIDRHHFNQAVLLYTRERYTKAEITAIFVKITEHHDALRMTYKEKKSGIIQTNRGPGNGNSFSLRENDLRNRENGKEKEELQTLVNEIQASIDLEKGPLMKLGLFHLEDGDRLLIVIHHLVMDGVSWRILLEDIETLHQQYLEKKPLALPLKTDSFKVWAETLAGNANSELFLKEKSYWKELELAIETGGAPGIKKDFAGEDNIAEDAGSPCPLRLSAGETGLLLTKVNEPFGTESNDILLSALGMSLKRCFAMEKTLLALEGHGREEILPEMDIKRTIGWFTAVYPVIFDNCYDTDLARQIKEVKESLRRVPNKGMGYGILKYLTAPGTQKGLEFK